MNVEETGREREGGWNVPEKEGEERVHSATKREEREGDSEGLRNGCDSLSETWYGA